MKLHEQLKLIDKYASVIIKYRYKSKKEFYGGRVEKEEWTDTLHDGQLYRMDFVKFFDAMYDEVDEIYITNSGKICIECHHVYKD